MKKLATVLIATLATPLAFSASFDCNKAHSNTEKMICADSELSAMDSELLPIYQQARKVIHNSKTFRKQGKQALNWREQHCQDKACLVRWYQQREKTLLQTISKQQSDDACVTDGKVIALEGVIKRASYTLEYQEPMSYLYLQTNKPRCAFTDSSLQEKGLEKIAPQQNFQLLIPESIPSPNKLLNKQVTLTAIPFTQHTMYHQTPLLLDVKLLEETKE